MDKLGVRTASLLQARGTVKTVYFLKPQVKSRSRLLKKLLGLKPSKKQPKIPLFKTVTPCVREGESVLRRVPELRDRVDLLHEYEIGEQPASAITTLLAELTDKYHLIISEANFQETLDRCKQTILTLDSTETNERWLSRVHPEHVRHAADCVRHLYQELEAARWQLEETWKAMEENVLGHLQIQRHRERAVEIERKIRNLYEPLMQEHPCVGNTLSQAELYRTHFTTTLYEPAKELLSQATEILEHVHRLTDRTQPSCDVTDILQRLTVALQPFTQRLQSLQDVYVAVHIFHLLFQKAMSWYKKVLKFLPDSLQERVKECARADVTILPMPVEWQQTVQSFLSKHPPPREQHIARLDTEIPPQVEKRLRLQARSLALRLRLLQRLLFSRRLPVKLLSAIFRWRNELCSTTQGSTSPSKERATNKPTGVRGDTVDSSSAPNLAAPPKPARLHPVDRTVSYSSSDTGDMEFSNTSLFSSAGLQFQDSPSEEDWNTQGEAPGKTLPGRSNSEVQEYQKPPKIDIRIVTPKGNITQGQNLDADAVQDSSDNRHVPSNKETDAERFIRLTLSPTETPAIHRRAFEFDDSLESEDFNFQLPDNQAGSESGIEVAEAEDPWDNVIDKIKAVSNSNLPSEVKIQCMSHLLSRSPLAEAKLGHRPGNMTSRQDIGRRAGRRHDALQYGDGRKATERSPTFRSEDGGLRPAHWTLASRESDGQRSAPEEDGGWRGAGSEPHYEQRFLAHAHEKPAYTVAKLRHRLAQSLWDLTSASQTDEQQTLTGSGGWASTANLHAPPKPARQHDKNVYAAVSAAGPHRKHHTASLMRRSYENGLDSAEYENTWRDDSSAALRRSYEDGLDTVHHPRRVKHGQDKMVAWRSYEDGLDFVSSRPHRDDGPSARASGRSFEGALEPVASQARPRYAKKAVHKNPYRWRQNIVGEYLPPASKTHHPSRDFIAPSFLRPYSSTTTINTAGRDDTSGRQYPDVKFEVGGYGGMEQMSMSDSDSTSYGGGSRHEHGGSAFDRLSDEVEQEYLSQDEVESSLKRSQRILMEAEEKLKQRAQRTVSSGAEDTRNLDDKMENSENTILQSEADTRKHANVPNDAESPVAKETERPRHVDVQRGARVAEW
nr:hypothetical protein BaRGS_002483 [Batillaria attramentaria]